MALTFVACVNDAEVLRRRLLTSPCLAAGHPHPLLLHAGCTSAAQGLAWGLALARTAWLVWVHQDVFLPAGWDQLLAQQLNRLPGEVGLAGVYGVDAAGQHHGRVWDRDGWIGTPVPSPVEVSSLDELVLALRVDGAPSADPALGFHLYGSDLALAVRSRGHKAVVIDAPCEHHSRLAREPDRRTLEAFVHSAQALARRWPQALPVHTANARIDPDPTLQSLCAQLGLPVPKA